MDEDGVTTNYVEFEDSMTRIHDELGIPLPEWLRR